MTNIAIEFNNVGKQYRLGRVGTGTLSHDINRWWQTTILRRDDPYLKIGETNDRTTKGDSEYVWALKDISFHVEQGDVVGIIGKNGAGKSTLLKLLSHITSPSTGSIRYKGRIASLLEVGTGFHPELTGRENIYMNGSIMGMTKAEITRKLDEIVDFAGVERYLDTPVKRYSSGMTVRLGFAVAAFLEPEILVVDEVLTVGDAEFQKKAIGKMQDVASNGGRTVLFVSHNMASVRALCNNGIVLKNGRMEKTGSADECVDYYIQNNINVNRDYFKVEKPEANYSREIEFVDVRMRNNVNEMSTSEPILLEFTIKRNKPSLTQGQIGLVIRDTSDVAVGGCYSEPFNMDEGKEMFRVKLTIPHHQLSKGSYSMNFSLNRFNYTAAIRDYDHITRGIAFEIKYVDKEHTIPFVFWPKLGSALYQDTKIETENI